MLLLLLKNTNQSKLIVVISISLQCANTVISMVMMDVGRTSRYKVKVAMRKGVYRNLLPGAVSVVKF